MSDAGNGRLVSESMSERTEVIFPSETNALGSLFGGRLMQLIDVVGAIAAVRHAKAIVVTASMDHLDFVTPVRVGEFLTLKASVNRAFKSSMEVGVKAMVEDVLGAGGMRHVASAYLTYVALDRSGQKMEVPPVIPETEHQKRRFADAANRRAMRTDETLRKKELRATQGHIWNV